MGEKFCLGCNELIWLCKRQETSTIVLIYSLLMRCVYRFDAYRAYLWNTRFLCHAYAHIWIILHIYLCFCDALNTTPARYPYINWSLYFFQIELLIRDTHRQEVDAQKELLDLWNRGVVGLIGASSSNPTSAIAAIAGIPLLKLVLVGFKASSLTLSDKEKYPTFVRVNPSQFHAVRVMTKLLHRTFFIFFKPHSVVSNSSWRYFQDITHLV